MQKLPFYKRRQTHTVFVGQVGVGGQNPIRIQSMTTSDTKDTPAIIQEMKDLVAAGCEIIRVTVPTKADCENLASIRAAMKAEGIKTPLVADIHFTPSVALDVVKFVDKVRINPGNFVDKKLFKVREYTDEQYAEELERIKEKFTPLVKKCQKYGVSMRIGTNHGSLSDRILNRYGDTPQGMVESAIEFLHIAEDLGYRDIILSMKASNVQVMVAAYRLLVQRMDELGMTYPLHLGVTEAGDGEDGRTKSAIGIGTLLEEGIGDTIRVSLTEDSVHEIPVAGALAAPYNTRLYQSQMRDPDLNFPAHLDYLQNPLFSISYARRSTFEIQTGPTNTGHKNPIRVWTAAHQNDIDSILACQNDLMAFEGVEVSCEHITESTDALKNRLSQNSLAFSVISKQVAKLKEANADKLTWSVTSLTALKELSDLAHHCQTQNTHLELSLETSAIDLTAPLFPQELQEFLNTLTQIQFHDYSLSLKTQTPLQDYRILRHSLDQLKNTNPIHLRYQSSHTSALLDSSVQIGALLLDGIGDSLQIDAYGFNHRLRLNYGILQGCRLRVSKTEYISCPSCGRTLFDLQEVTNRIRSKTSHLKGVKIAIMGCIVNGPGEMADADFGYVGTGIGKISLYVGKECVERNICEAEADGRLIDLIKRHDMWTEPQQKTVA